MYVGIISDTHGVFSDGFRKFLEPVDVVWHAGDFGGGIGFAEQLAAFKPLVGVHGNCDGQELRYDNPLFRVFDCAGMKVLMTHIGGYPGHYDRRALALIEEHRPDIFVCGHSHILRVMNDRKRGFMVINPGAAGEYGFHTVRTALRFHIDQGSIHDMEVYELARKQAVL